MNTLFRNLFFAANRFKLSTALNVLGLSVAFSVFLVIMTQVYYDRTFNSGIKDADRIYFVSRNEDGELCANFSGWEYDKIQQTSAHIRKSAIVMGWSEELMAYVNGEYVRTAVKCAEPSYFEMLGFQLLCGDISSLKDEKQVLVSESFARKYFHRTDIVGQPLNKKKTLFVGGVFRDFPENSMVDCDLYGGVDADEVRDDMANYSFLVLLEVDEPVALDCIKAQMETLAAKWAETSRMWEKRTYGFIPASEIRYVDRTLRVPPVTPVNQTTEMFLITVALAVVIIAGINFANFANALAPMRIRSINTQKVLGATAGSLRRSLVAESVVVGLLAYAVSLGIVGILSETSFVRLTEAGLSLSGYWPVTVATGTLALLTGFLAGLYPAVRITSVPPAVALKGNFGMTPKGMLARNLMIGVQFCASLVLIVVSVFIYRQRQFMMETDYGFQRDEIVVCEINETIGRNLNEVMQSMKALPFVRDVSHSAGILGSGNLGMSWGRMEDGEYMKFSAVPVAADFLKTAGIELLEGRDFEPGDSCAMIFNEAARSRYPNRIDIGKVVDGMQVIGICKNLNYQTARVRADEPMAMFIKTGWPNTSYLYVRVAKGTNMFQAVGEVRKVVARTEPDYPVEIYFYDQILNNTFTQEKNLSVQITLFSLLAVLISVVGVFGLVMFDSEYRRREIAVRKVFGATDLEIIRLFNAKYFRILAVCFVVSVPVAWYIVGRWMENFAYRTELSWWVFALAFALLGAITLATVTFQCWRNAHANPVECLKYE